VLARVTGDIARVRPIKQFKNGVCGIAPRNKEQYFAVDALTDQDLRLVTLMGKAGTGKTLLAMAAALHEVLAKKAYRGLVVARPTVPVGKELGFLPGDLEQKMAPWMRPVLDTLEYIFDSARQIGGHRQYDSLLKSGVIEIQAISLIRGRSINNRYILVDEAQNLSPLEVKTIITRVGADSKVVVTGDPYQIDNPYVDSGSNGFIYLANRFREEALSAHVQLRKGERSQLAELAANLL
jgi:PhoH-like ATPase